MTQHDCKFEERVITMSADIAAAKSDITTIKSDISSLKKVGEHLQALSEHLAKLSVNFQNVQLDIQDYIKQFAEHEKDSYKVRKQVAIMWLIFKIIGWSFFPILGLTITALKQGWSF